MPPLCKVAKRKGCTVLIEYNPSVRAVRRGQLPLHKGAFVLCVIFFRLQTGGRFGMMKKSEVSAMKTVRRMAAILLLAALLCCVAAAASVEIDVAYACGKYAYASAAATELPEGAQTIIALYDEDGRMIAVRFASEVSGVFAFEPSYARAFVTNGEFVPLCAAEREDMIETKALEVYSEQELIAANDNPKCAEIYVAASVKLPKSTVLVITKDLYILDGVTLDATDARTGCTGRVTEIGSGKLIGELPFMDIDDDPTDPGAEPGEWG